MPTLRIKLHRGTAMSVNRLSVNAQRLVYVVLAEKRLKYRWGRSRIAYIGTTRRGIKRVAQSAAHKAPEVLGLHGVRSFDVRVVTSARRQNVKTWHKLERAMLLVFRQTFGDVPLCNSQGARIQETDEFQYFRRSRIQQLITELSSD